MPVEKVIRVLFPLENLLFVLVLRTRDRIVRRRQAVYPQPESLLVGAFSTCTCLRHDEILLLQGGREKNRGRMEPEKSRLALAFLWVRVVNVHMPSNAIGISGATATSAQAA